MNAIPYQSILFAVAWHLFYTVRQKDGNVASDRLSLRLPETLRSRMEDLSKSAGRTESDLTREAIEEYLLRHADMPTCYDLAEQSGVIGCVKGDLRTNPKHMDGFGQ